MPFDGIRNSALVRTVADVLEDLPDLLQKEVRLVQAEFTEKIKDGFQESAWMMVAGLLGLVAFVILSEAVIFAIASFGLALYWSCLIVAAVIGACAAATFLYGRSAMPNTLVPTRSVSQVSEDIRTMKEQLR
jgi:Putative Actinobacterial Holin-X, holin superfamily III